ncbi:MAG: hypothetical protein LBE12_10090 [Planctomycetaceae bacterium]|nr:hypothetical protein [Planctomycetaceae bacterium]
MRHYPRSTLHSQLLSRPCRALENRRVPAPAVALRFTAGYAFHTPSGVSQNKNDTKILPFQFLSRQLRLILSSELPHNLI